MTLYILSLIWFALFLVASYSAIINGATWGVWVTGICLWILFAFLLGDKLFD